jgi:hypothetical protein
MDNVLEVRWTLTPKIAPRPWIACSGCGAPRPFTSSDRIRLNANGRKLDAWLIYKCVACDNAWKRPLFERVDVRAVQPALLEALQSNDSDWIQSRAFDVADLKRHSRRIEEFADVDVERTALGSPQNWTILRIGVAVRFAACVRLERLLASELHLTRSRLMALNNRARLTIEPHRIDALRRRPMDGMRIVLDLAGEADRRRIGLLALGGDA